MTEGNLLIRASAGTGKTFALATRFIRLMLFDGVSPEQVVALTFSRAAAREIYEKILSRLCKAAENAAGACAEAGNLLKGLDAAARAAIGKKIAMTPEAFADLLRRVVDTQHTGAIATLDSFILRIVRNFPIEMGFQNAVEVLDALGEREALDRAVSDVLARTDGTEAFVEAFRAAREGRLPRSLAAALERMLTFEGWRPFVLAHPEARFWTRETMEAALGLPPETPDAPWRIGSFVDAVEPREARNAVEKFFEFLGKLEPGDSPFPANKNMAGEFARAVARHPLEPYVVHVKSDGEEVRWDYPYEVFAAAHDDLVRAAASHFRRRLAVIEAKLRLFSIVERVYDASTRRAGKLTFADFTDYSAASEDSERGLAIQNLEFRFDAQFDHWALDEFQDTSEVQWRCLRRLVDSAAHAGGGRTVITVGDLKQSIYTWRGGDETPFKDMMGWAAFRPPYGRIVDADTSYRYRANICRFVNAVFGPENLASGLIPSARAAAVARWTAPDCWKTHLPESRDDGSLCDDDAIRVIGVPPAEPDDEDAPKTGSVEELLPALAQALRAVWNGHERVNSPESVGILVRTNEEGKAVAEYLRTMPDPVPVVWEGFDAVGDVPVVRALVRMLTLADHPDDSFAWEFSNRLLPVRETVFPDLETPAAVSARIALDLAAHGLARTLKTYTGALVASDTYKLDALSRARLRSLVQAAVDYERRPAADAGVDGFAAYLESAARRTGGATSRAVRILTIHRSKGLTLDRVFLPIAEGSTATIVDVDRNDVLYGKERPWILPHLDADLAALNPETAAVLEERRDAVLLEALRTYYVACTRARKAMYIVLSTAGAEGGLVPFRALVQSAAKRADHHASAEPHVLYEAGTVPPFEPGKKPNSQTTDAPQAPAPRAQTTAAARKPSAAHSFFTEPADALFDAGYGAAAARGTQEHERFRSIEWADAQTLADLPEAFRPAFTKPAGPASVWRERAYERFVGGRWESGRFDRVVFTGTGASRTAVIYDFKTNARRAGESVAAFETRMKSAYAGQMRTYRAALLALTGLPAAAVKNVLLLTATQSAVACDG